MLKAFIAMTILWNVTSIKAFTQNIIASDSLLKTLRKAHPRIIATSNDFDHIRQKIKSDINFNKRYQKLVKQGEEILLSPVSTYIIPDGLRLLATSRKVKDNMLTLGLLYQTTGDRKYAERAWKELDGASKFTDWNPKHFLDVGEMTFGFAIGYDWMYDYWTPEQRTQIRNAIVEHGLNRAMNAYKGLAIERMSFWIKVDHNWNQVCNGGIGAGALAIADEEPKLCEEILRNVIQNIPYAMKHYGPDGAWNEGPGYWSYATNYNIVIIASLQSALGTDFGLSEIEGFSKTALFPIYMTGPSGKSFNYADGSDSKIGGSALAWLIQKFQFPLYSIAKDLQAEGGTKALDLVWNSHDIPDKISGDLPLDSYFRNAEVVSMRSAWNDGNALFVGLKAGDNKANHSHLDLGSFVLDALGERWIVDLGAESYQMPQYFGTGSTRWTYYRTRPEGNNTLVFNPGKDPGQEPGAVAKIIKFNTAPTNAFAIADLSAAYVRDMKNVKRGIAMAERKRIIIRDEIEAANTADVHWFAHTPATVSLDAGSRTAILTLKGKKMEARIISPGTARFSILEAKPLPTSPQPEGVNPNKGISRLSIQVKNVKKENIVVEFKPVSERSAYKGNFLKSLSSW